MFKSKDSVAPADASNEAASVQLARTRARRRLIGAALLVALGIVGFPLLFETQPRPIAVDIPIEIPPRDQAPALKLPAQPPAAPASAAAAEPAASSTRAQASAPDAVLAVPPAAPEVAASAASAAATASRSERTAEPAATAARPAAEPVRAAPDDAQRDAQRAQAILDGKPVTAASAPGKAARFVVQAGAYTDSGALREARQKVERLGLKTYTQVIESDAGRRTRVRVGPFESREDAEKAAARIKSAGLAASILSL